MLYTLVVLVVIVRGVCGGSGGGGGGYGVGSFFFFFGTCRVINIFSVVFFLVHFVDRLVSRHLDAVSWLSLSLSVRLPLFVLQGGVEGVV